MLYTTAPPSSLEWAHVTHSEWSVSANYAAFDRTPSSGTRSEWVLLLPLPDALRQCVGATRISFGHGVWAEVHPMSHQVQWWPFRKSDYLLTLDDVLYLVLPDFVQDASTVDVSYQGITQSFGIPAPPDELDLDVVTIRQGAVCNRQGVVHWWFHIDSEIDMSVQWHVGDKGAWSYRPWKVFAAGYHSEQTAEPLPYGDHLRLIAWGRGQKHRVVHISGIVGKAGVPSGRNVWHRAQWYGSVSANTWVSTIVPVYHPSDIERFLTIPQLPAQVDWWIDMDASWYDQAVELITQTGLPHRITRMGSRGSGADVECLRPFEFDEERLTHGQVYACYLFIDMSDPEAFAKTQWMMNRLATCTQPFIFVESLWRHAGQPADTFAQNATYGFGFGFVRSQEHHDAARSAMFRRIERETHRESICFRCPYQVACRQSLSSAAVPPGSVTQRPWSLRDGPCMLQNWYTVTSEGL